MFLTLECVSMCFMSPVALSQPRVSDEPAGYFVLNSFVLKELKRAPRTDGSEDVLENIHRKTQWRHRLVRVLFYPWCYDVDGRALERWLLSDSERCVSVPSPSQSEALGEFSLQADYHTRAEMMLNFWSTMFLSVDHNGDKVLDMEEFKDMIQLVTET